LTSVKNLSLKLVHVLALEFAQILFSSPWIAAGLAPRPPVGDIGGTAARLDSDKTVHATSNSVLAACRDHRTMGNWRPAYRK